MTVRNRVKGSLPYEKQCRSCRYYIKFRAPASALESAASICTKHLECHYITRWARAEQRMQCKPANLSLQSTLVT